MARTKGNHTNFRTPSPSPSPPRSPSPPSRPSSPANLPPASLESSDYQTPSEATPHTSPQNEPKSKLSSNPNTVKKPSFKSPPTKPSLLEKVVPVTFVLPPLFQATTASFNQTPPHLKTQAKKAKSTPSFVPRRSYRLLSTTGAKKTGKLDNTVQEIVDSDEEDAQTKSSQQPNPNPIPQKTTSLTENQETTDPPTNRENEPVQNQDDFIEIEPISVAFVFEKPSSPIEIPKEVPESPSQHEEKE